MLVMRATKYPAYPLGEFVGTKQTIGLDHLTFAMDPLGFYGIKPRALLWQQAAYDPHSLAAFSDPAVVITEPAPDLFGDMPAGVVPNQEQHLLADLFEPLAAPLKEPGRYAAHRPPIYESQPPLLGDLWQVESVTRDGFRLGVVLGDRLLDEAQRLALLGEAAQGGQSHPAPPALVQETHRPGFGVDRSHVHQSVAPPFFLSYRGSGEVIQRLARIHLTPSRRESVARMVSPETRLLVSPSRKAASAAISKGSSRIRTPSGSGGASPSRVRRSSGRRRRGSFWGARTWPRGHPDPSG